ncbi:MAG: SIS domain-containing protein [Gammaproteobacteria bacterium]|nr:SIS domain-containing protein [Gammaproteobacteria bacterium]
MSLADQIQQMFQASLDTHRQALPVLAGPILQAAELIFSCIIQGQRVLACGNGGSAGFAQHFAAKMLNRFEEERPGLPAMALTPDSSTLTAIANDYGFEEVFAKQVAALGQPGDLLLVISTSGQSINLLRAIQEAQDKDMGVMLLSGADGGELSKQLRDTDLELRVPADNRRLIHESHLLIIHCLCDLIDRQLLGH